MKTKIVSTFILGICCIVLSAITVQAQNSQNGVQTRSITSDDFGVQRPAAGAPSAGSTTRSRRYNYGFVRTDKNLLHHRRKPKRKTPMSVAKGEPKVTDLGITLWKLRPPQPNESGFYLPVNDEKKERKLWLAERMPEDTVFRAGDKVRFAVESSVTGYLYVFDRETSADGSFGAPLMLFPEKADDDNSVRPGLLFDIPDQREDLPYFNLTAKKPNYAGELLTILVSAEPLPGFKPSNLGGAALGEALADYEFGAQVEIFSRKDSDDKFFSKTESAATCGSRTRDENKANSERTPCGIASRQLTRDEPYPQSVYRVKTTAGQPAVVFVKLAVAH